MTTTTTTTSHRITPQPETLLDYVRLYESLGLITFPCCHQPGDPTSNKRPLVKWSSEWARHDTTWRLAKWQEFADRIDILIGACPGELVVIDIDNHEAWSDFCKYRRKHHDEGFTPEGYVWGGSHNGPLTITPRGGYHLWYHAKGQHLELGKNERQQWGFDWRAGVAGYLIVPGPKGAWEWAKGGAIWECEPPPIHPKQLAFLLSEQGRGSNADGKTQGQGLPFDDDHPAPSPSTDLIKRATKDPQREGRIEAYLTELPFHHGTRNKSTFQLARWILTDLAGTVDEAMWWCRRLHQIWSHFGHAAHPDSEIRSTVMSAAQGVGRRPIGCGLEKAKTAKPAKSTKSDTPAKPSQKPEKQSDKPSDSEAKSTEKTKPAPSCEASPKTTTDLGEPAELKPIEIVVVQRDRTQNRNRVYNAAVLTNERRRWFYRFAERAGAVDGNPGECEFSAFDVVRFHNEVLDRCPVLLEKRTKHGLKYTPDRLDSEDVRLVLELLSRSDEVPEITQLARGPVFVDGGTLLAERGYDELSRVFVDLPNGFQLGTIDTSEEAVQDAVDTIASDMLGDFRWVSCTDLAHYMGALLTPFIRPLIAGCPVPAVIIDAPTKGSGKTLLVEVAGTLANGVPPNPRSWPTDEAETQKALLALVMAGAGLVLFDNVTGKIKSPTLDGFLTSASWSGRVLGESRIVRAPNTTHLWFTSNNAEIGGDLARRCIRVRIDPEMERPWLRTGFRHPRIAEWVSRNRAKLCNACCTMVAAWIKAGAPNGPATMGSFQAWASVVSGVLDVCGVGGFLDREAMEELEDEADEEGAERRAFVDRWWRENREGRLVVSEIVEMCEQHRLIGGVLAGKSGHAAVCRVGRWVAKLRDLVFSDLGSDRAKVKVRRTAGSPRVYWLESVSD